MKSQLIAALLCLYPLGSAYATECFIATRNDVPGDLNDMIHKNKYDFRGYALTCNYLKTMNAGIEVASTTFTHDGGGIATTALNIRLFDLKLAQETGKFLYSTSSTNAVWTGLGSELNSQIEAINKVFGSINVNIVSLERQRKLFGIKQY
ncbi:hypothetical protein MOW08_06670 [Acinetobacter schindleri]|nr:hypothetical protein MOW08_06670 [Acinetobacter schindleri]